MRANDASLYSYLTSTFAPERKKRLGIARLIVKQAVYYCSKLRIHGTEGSSVPSSEKVFAARSAVSRLTHSLVGASTLCPPTTILKYSSPEAFGFSNIW